MNNQFYYFHIPQHTHTQLHDDLEEFGSMKIKTKQTNGFAVVVRIIFEDAKLWNVVKILNDHWDCIPCVMFGINYIIQI